MSALARTVPDLLRA